MLVLFLAKLVVLFPNPNSASRSFLSVQYVDLDEFLSENNIPVDVNNLTNGTAIGHRSESISQSNGLLGLPTKREKRSPSPSECVSPDTMNPPSPADSSESRENINP